MFSNKHKKLGRKGYDKKIRDLIIELKIKNPDYGCLRIAQTVNKLLGKEISEQTVRRILRKKHLDKKPENSAIPSEAI